jgi:hypothetical protein
VPRCWPMKLLALGAVVPRGGGPNASARPRPPTELGRVAGMSFSLSFTWRYSARQERTGWDDPSDVSCKDSTRQHAVDDPLLSFKQQAGIRLPQFQKMRFAM